jgi:hypothetical protein
MSNLIAVVFRISVSACSKTIGCFYRNCSLQVKKELSVFCSELRNFCASSALCPVKSLAG